MPLHVPSHVVLTTESGIIVTITNQTKNLGPRVVKLFVQSHTDGVAGLVLEPMPIRLQSSLSHQTPPRLRDPDTISSLVLHTLPPRETNRK